MSHPRLFDRGVSDRNVSPRDVLTTTTTRRLAAILAADVVGYSRLMGADEEPTHERLKTHLRQLVDPKIQEHHGRIVKSTGDGMLAVFQRRRRSPLRRGDTTGDARPQCGHPRR